ncbi:ribonuclease H-like domain-containing protein [Tanacetum coccineum]
MDQDFAHMVAASKVPMLKPENGNTAPKTTVVEGVKKVMPPTTAKEKAQIRLEVKARSTLMMGIPNEHQLKFNLIKDAKLLMEAVEKRFGGNAATKKTQRNLLKQQYENFIAPSSEMLDQTFDRLQKLVSQLELLGETISQEDVNQKLLRSLSPEWNTHVVVWRNKPDLDTMSMDDFYNNLKVITNGAVSTAQAINTANGVSATNTQVNASNIDNLSDALICRKLTINGNESVGFDKSKVKCYNYHKKGHFAKECRAPRNQDYKNKESTRRTVPVETSTSIALVSCDGLGGYDLSDQAEEGPNYALMAYSSSSSNSDVSNYSNCLKSFSKTVENLKSQYDPLHKDFKKYELMVLAYKSGLESVEEKLENIAVRELRKKLEIAQKEKDGIQFNVDKFENASKSLNKLIKSQIVDNCKKGLGYNAVLPPYTGNFMPSIPDLSFNSLDEFVNKPVSDGEEENMSKTKTEKKTVKPSIAKIEFVKPKQQEKIARKTVKQVEKHRQNTYSPRGNQRNWNNMMSQRLRSNFEMFNKACYNMVPGAVLMKSSLVLVNTARQVNVAHTKTTVNAARLMVNTVKDKNINIVRPKAVVNAARPKAVVNVVKGNNVNAVKASACWVW